MNMPMSQNDYQLMQEAVDMLRQLQDFDQFAEVSDVVSRLQDRPQQMTVYPYLLKEYRNRWFLFASKSEDMALQTLALDRIVSIGVAADIAWWENPDFDTEHYFDDIIGVTKPVGARPYAITFWASPTTCKYIETKPLHPSQKLLNDNPDGSCVFQIEVVINREMFSVFMSYGSGVRILSPEKAANYLKSIFVDAAKAYD